MDFFSAAAARSIEKPLALFFEVISVCACYFSIMNMFVHIHIDNSSLEFIIIEILSEDN